MEESPYGVVKRVENQMEFCSKAMARLGASCQTKGRKVYKRSMLSPGISATVGSVVGY